MSTVHRLLLAGCAVMMAGGCARQDPLAAYEAEYRRETARQEVRAAEEARARVVRAQPAPDYASEVRGVPVRAAAPARASSTASASAGSGAGSAGRTVQRPAAMAAQAPAGNAPADEARPIGPQRGDWELTLSSTFGADRSFDVFLFGADMSLGTFVTDDLQLYLRQQLLIAVADADGVAGTTRIGASYHFDLDRWRPFLTANIGLAYADIDGFSTSEGIAALGGGLKYYLGAKTFFFVQAEYTFLLDSFSDGITLGQFGFGYRW